MSEALKLAKSLVGIHNGHDDEGPTVFFDAAEMLKAQAAEIERLASNQEAHVRELAALNVRCERLRALTWAPPCHNGNSAEHWNKLAVDRYQENCKLEAELESLRAELETERMRLAACGVIAMADTPASAIEARKMNPEYDSASAQDVARRVDECISLRAEPRRQR